MVVQVVLAVVLLPVAVSERGGPRWGAGTIVDIDRSLSIAGGGGGVNVSSRAPLSSSFFLSVCFSVRLSFLFVRHLSRSR